ncbi:unnamed protein product [Clonostachys chloroleuca]|uniref:Uncharacterized protein n=1 Tax=Clonostachys chloroleuca TaxID=1926264 RepID=A0AA35PYL4_9HYPO|nr:unnamed protein product [Clonostachys chloroleuca]
MVGEDQGTKNNDLIIAVSEHARKPVREGGSIVRQKGRYCCISRSASFLFLHGGDGAFPLVPTYTPKLLATGGVRCSLERCTGC